VVDAMLHLINIIKCLPLQSFANIGLAVSYNDIYNALKVRGIDDRAFLNNKLKELENNNQIEVFRIGPFDKAPIYAARIKSS
jgi:hypothetical protein